MSDPFLDNLPQHVQCLGKAFDHPRRSCQRLVEQMTFLPDGGRRWIRTLQVQLPPDIPSDDNNEWRVVSLGVFRRRRLPDLVAFDATGARINLLTRNQHGTLLVGYVIVKHFKDFPRQTDALEKAVGTPERELYEKLIAILYDTVTTVGDVDSLKRRLRKPGAIYEYLLRSFDPIPGDVSERVDAFRSNFEELLYFTHYLCWIKGKPNEVINLQTSHTTADSGQRPEWSEKGSPSGLDGFSSPGLERRAGWFRAFGLAPLPCECSTPSNGFASSYYFTLKPPAKTEVTFLDWSSGNSFMDDKTERDSALDSVHFHYRHDSRPAPLERGRAVRAYMRCMTHGHKQIAIGAALNFVFVILVASGRLSNTIGGSAQTWLLVTPTILTAYIADQQRHYYAYPTRRQRAILWIYLAISITFLVTISFRLTEGSVEGSHWKWFDTGAAWLLLVSSAAVFTWFMFLGYLFRAATSWQTTRKLKATAASRKTLTEILDEKQPRMAVRETGLAMLPSSQRVYERVVYNYCKIVFGLVVAVSLATILGIKIWWKPSSEVEVSQAKLTTVQSTKARGTLTTTTWPSSVCKACNVKLRFVPSAQTASK